MKPVRRLAPACLVAVGLSALPVGAAGQASSAEAPAWTFVVYGADRNPIEVRIESADRVGALVDPSVHRDGASFGYEYTVVVDRGSPQALRSFQVDCPGDQAAIMALAARRTDDAPAEATTTDANGLASCTAAGGPVPPGETVSLTFTSRLLPAVGHARLVGVVEIPDAARALIAGNEAARARLEEVTGTTGGWKTLPMIVPARDPAQIDAAAGLHALRGDFARSCGELGWIHSQVTCAALREVLLDAASSLQRGDPIGTRDALERFVRELDAHDRSAPGEVIGRAAYALLRPMAEHVLRRL